MSVEEQVYGRILALDDESYVLALYERVLKLAESELALFPGLLDPAMDSGANRTARFESVSCSTEEQVVEAAAEAARTGRNFAIALLDLRLAGELRGLRAAERIRAIDPYVHIVIVTGDAEIVPAQAATRVPPADKLLFMRKPFEVQELARLIVSLSAKWHGERIIRERNSTLQESIAHFSSTVSRIGHELDTQNARIRAAQEELRLVYTALQAAANAIVIVASDGSIKWCNPAFEKMSGYAEDEVTGRNLAYLCAEEHAAEHFGEIWAQVREHGVWHGETWARRKDGSHYAEAQTITAVYGSDGGITHFVTLKEDVTPRKREAEEALSRQRQMVQADKLATLGILVSGVAHEVNNPNHFILSNVTLIRDCWQDARAILDRYFESEGDYVLGGLNYSEARDSVPELLEEVLGGARRIRNIVQELRDYARETPQELSEEVDLNGVMRAATTLMSNMINKATDTFTVTYFYDAPKVRGSFQKLEQVLINLLQNACQALPSRDRAIHAEVYQDAELDMVGVLVEDKGIGIPQESLEHLTMPFFTTKRSTGGTGLGLSISANIVREHGGTLSFESDPGSGTRARISLPADRRAAYRERVGEQEMGQE